MRDLGEPVVEPGGEDDELSLVFLCCHPSLDPAVRVALTLRAVCGLTTPEVAAAFLFRPTMAKRLTRSNPKIRGGRHPVPREGRGRACPPPARRASKVVYLVFTQGHMAARGTPGPQRLCVTAVSLARRRLARLLEEPEVRGSWPSCSTDARRAARTDAHGDLVLLEDQDRSRWNAALIAEGEALLEGASARGRPLPAPGRHRRLPRRADCGVTDWREIALLYDDLLQVEPSPVQVTGAVAIAMSRAQPRLVVLDAPRPRSTARPLAPAPHRPRRPAAALGPAAEAYRACGAPAARAAAAGRRFIERGQAELGGDSRRF